MRSEKSFLYLSILVLFLTFNLLSCGGGDDGFIVVPEKSELKVFVTSKSGTGDLSTWDDADGKTGLEAGDAICQAAADNAGLSGTFRAWLSTSTTDAYCHIQGLTGTKSDKCGEAALPTAAGPWFRMGDNHPFSDTIDKLINQGQVFVPVYYDENNNKVTDYYFTGTQHTGILSVNYNCADWTSNSGSDNVSMGNPLGTTQRWTSLTTANCVGTRRLLCMQTGSGKPLPAITAPANAKKVFITSASYSGNFGGLLAADTICQDRAHALGLPNHDKFKAWLSDGLGNDAIDRFSSDGPWYRLDGVKVADSRADLTDGELFTSINYTGTSYIGNVVWTGTTVDGLYNSHSCVNWTSDASTDNGIFASATYINQFWTEWGPRSCNFIAGLYCFEDE